MPGIDLVQREVADQRGRQQFGVRPAPRANGFEGGHAIAILTEKGGEQGGEEGFANPRAGAGDKVGRTLHFAHESRNQPIAPSKPLTEGPGVV